MSVSGATGRLPGARLVAPVATLEWREGRLFIIDQTLLPGVCKSIPLDTAHGVWEAIRALRIRGAPAIGICAAYGLLVALKEKNPADTRAAKAALEEAAAYLATSRPTAVNLFWALDRMKARAATLAENAPLEEFLGALEAEATAIYEEDLELCQGIGTNGATLINEGDGVLTHCNAGGLATSAYGTALAVFFKAHEQGKNFHVFADETRPLLQGARLTAWELLHAGIDTTLICDNTAAQVMKEGRVQLVVVGADRIAANGDTANKIGTYSVAVLAKAHGIPFYVAAPYSTFDFTLNSGDEIPIEQRDPREITHGFGQITAPEEVSVYSPAFDVTPAGLISGIITERGILRPDFRESIAKLAASVGN